MSATRVVLDGSSGKTKAEQAHVSAVVDLDCIVCRIHFGIRSPAEIAHLNGVGAGLKSSWYEVLPLCPPHHRGVGHRWGYHLSPEGFIDRFGTEDELLAAVKYLLKGGSDDSVRDKFNWCLQPSGSVHNPRPLSEEAEGGTETTEHKRPSVLQDRRGRKWARITDCL